MAEGSPLFGDSLTDQLCCICFAMEQPTAHPNHAGKLRDHLPFHDIDVDLAVDPVTKLVRATAHNRITLQ
jgi:hypothetical protein